MYKYLKDLTEPGICSNGSEINSKVYHEDCCWFPSILCSLGLPHVSFTCMESSFPLLYSFLYHKLMGDLVIPYMHNLLLSMKCSESLGMPYRGAIWSFCSQTFATWGLFSFHYFPHNFQTTKQTSSWCSSLPTKGHGWDGSNWMNINGREKATLGFHGWEGFWKMEEVHGTRHENLKKFIEQDMRSVFSFPLYF